MNIAFRTVRNFIQRHRILFLLISVAVIVHLSVFYSLSALAKQHPDALHASFPIAGGGDDGIDYNTLGDHMLSYGTFSLQSGVDAPPETYRVPGYPFFLAAVKYVTGTFNTVPFFHIMFLALSALLVYAIVLVVSPAYTTIGLITVGLFLFDPMLFFSTQFIATESLYTLLFLFVVYCLIQKSRSAYLSYALAGLVLGISAYVRPAGLTMFIPITIWFLWRLVRTREERKRILKCAGLFFLGFFLVVTPWVVRNGIETGVYEFSSLDAFNMIEFNIPLYLTYKYDYKEPIEKIRADIHQQLGMSTYAQLQDLRNSATIRKLEWKILGPNLLGYVVFHISKSANFFFNPGTKLTAGFLRGFWKEPPHETWHPQTSFVNSVLDGRVQDVLAWFLPNLPYLAEIFFLVLLFLCGLYWYWVMRRSEAAVLLFGLVFFLALLTSPITNARYRIPVIAFIDLAGIAGAALILKKFRKTAV